jgi:hypothetical protein
VAGVLLPAAIPIRLQCRVWFMAQASVTVWKLQSLRGASTINLHRCTLQTTQTKHYAISIASVSRTAHYHQSSGHLRATCPRAAKSAAHHILTTKLSTELNPSLNQACTYQERKANLLAPRLRVIQAALVSVQWWTSRRLCINCASRLLQSCGMQAAALWML